MLHSAYTEWWNKQLCCQTDRIIQTLQEILNRKPPAVFPMCECAPEGSDGDPFTEPVGFLCFDEGVITYFDTTGANLGSVKPDGWCVCGSDKIDRVCTPYLANFAGSDDLSVIRPFNSVGLWNRSCCCDIRVTITPEQGVPFSVIVEANQKLNPPPFNCTLTGIAVGLVDPLCPSCPGDNGANALDLFEVTVQHTGYAD